MMFYKYEFCVIVLFSSPNQTSFISLCVLTAQFLEGLLNAICSVFVAEILVLGANLKSMPSS